MFSKNLPVKRIVIAGCRDYNDYCEAKQYLDFRLSVIRKENNIVIVSGCASGADSIGERYAEENGFEIEKHPADWKKYGRKAGPIRNKQMAEVSDYIICFWDGKSKGTKSMIECAKNSNTPLDVKMI
ncbi:MAG: DUF2493 domain-containing protein [Ruminococcaceae bacterium]|nr:DUF2493 domain-containing protein [Oscillospiraceae bacterium]